MFRIPREYLHFLCESLQFYEFSPKHVNLFTFLDGRSTSITIFFFDTLTQKHALLFPSHICLVVLHRSVDLLQRR